MPVASSDALELMQLLRCFLGTLKPPSTSQREQFHGAKARDTEDLANEVALQKGLSCGSLPLLTSGSGWKPLSPVATLCMIFFSCCTSSCLVVSLYQMAEEREGLKVHKCLAGSALLRHKNVKHCPSLTSSSFSLLNLPMFGGKSFEVLSMRQHKPIENGMCLQHLLQKMPSYRGPGIPPSTCQQMKGCLLLERAESCCFSTNHTLARSTKHPHRRS